MGNVIVIKADNYEVIVKNANKISNEYIYSLIENECDIYEIVRTASLSKVKLKSWGDLVMLVDEEGALKPNRKVNTIASALARYPFIYGNVVLVRECRGSCGYELASLSDSDAIEVLEELRRIVSELIRIGTNKLNKISELKRTAMNKLNKLKEGEV